MGSLKFQNSILLHPPTKQEIEFHVMEEMYAALYMRMCAEKMTFLGKDS